MQAGHYQFQVPAIRPEHAGVRMTVRRDGPWPDGPCLDYTFQGATSRLTGTPWTNRQGDAIDETSATWHWPGVALKDAAGNVLCVRMEQGRLVVPETPENLARAYPMTQADLDAAPNGVHAFIRHVVRPASATLAVDLLADLDVTITFEAI